MMPKQVKTQPAATIRLKMPLTSCDTASACGGQSAGMADGACGEVGGAEPGDRAGCASAASTGGAPKAVASSGTRAASRNGPVSLSPTGVVPTTRLSATQRRRVARSAGP